MPTVTVNGIQIYFERHGEGPPLLLVAGMASDSASWAPVTGLLGTHFDLIAFDNRCTGRTTPSPCDVGLDLMVDDCVALLDALEVPEAHVLGHSLGGIVGLHLASRYPERVASLVAAATGPAVAPMHIGMFTDMARIYEADGVPVALWFRLLFPWLFAPAFFANQEAVEVASQLAADYPYRQSGAALRAQTGVLADCLQAPDLAAVRCPVLALHAELDLMFPTADLSAFSPIANLTIASVADAGHSIHWDQPDAFAERIVSFHQDLA